MTEEKLDVNDEMLIFVSYDELQSDDSPNGEKNKILESYAVFVIDKDDSSPNGLKWSC